MAKNGIGIDIGTDAIRVVSGVDKKGVFQVKSLLVLPLSAAESSDPAARGRVLAQAVAEAGLKGEAIAGITGRDLMVRYNQVPPVPDWQLRQLMDFEVQELVDQSGDPLAADYNLIPVTSELTSDDTVLLALAKQATLDDHLEALGAAGLGTRSFTPNSIAIYNAWSKTRDDSGTLLILNIGARNSDIAIVSDGELLFARNLSGGGSLFDEALKATFNVSDEKAKKLKEQMANVAPFDRTVKLSSQEEKVSRALAGATGQVLSMVQSSVTFARSQTGQNDLRLDKVLLCGGGARLGGLDRYLETNVGVPVELFDPFDSIDASEVDEELDDYARAASVVALGLALQASYDDTYSIEILPEALKKARAFKERTVFVGLAALLAVLFLGFSAWRAKTDYEAATRDASAFTKKNNELKRRAENHERLQVEHAESARKIELLEERVVQGTGLSRTLALLQRYLPAELYVLAIRSSRSADAELGIHGEEARPVVVIEGEGREGAQGLATVFNAFVTALSADAQVPHTPKTQTSQARGEQRFQWTLTINFSERPAMAAAVDGDEDEEDEG